MRRSSALFGACLLLTTLTACSSADSGGDGDGAPVDRASLGKPTETSDQVAYSMGLQVGRNIATQASDLNIDYVIRGLEDAVSGAEPLMTDEEIMTAIQAYQTQLMSDAVEKNRAEGEAFLTSNAERDEVVSMPSGLQYEVVKQGEGARPAATDRVTVHYRGSLVDGTQFDSSYDRGQPATFRLDAVIPGWSEGLQQMSVGSIYKLFIPGDLAYGPNPPPSGPIGPDATLIFVVELLEIASE